MANNIPYFFQNSGASYNEVTNTNFQLGIFDIDDIRLTSSQINTLHNQDKTIFSYVSVGEAVTYRDYWQENGWDRNPPDLLLSKNPNWDSYNVKFWDPKWQEIVIEQVERIAKAGYDGMYMDVVDVYTVDAVKDAYHGSSSARQEMIDFVKILSAHAKAIDPDFKLIANNAQDLLTDVSYLKAIDGVGNESLYYSSNNNRVNWTEGNLDLLEHAMNAGKLILDIDYPTSDAAQESFIKMAVEDGVIPFIGNRSLNGEIDSTNYKINDILSDDWLKLLDDDGSPTPTPTPNPNPNPNPTPGNTMNGTERADNLIGMAANNKMDGKGENDTLNGGNGNDTLQGGAGNDKLLGAAGNDSVLGGAGHDSLYGGAGNDQLYGNKENDMLYGEAGNDILQGGEGNDVLRGGAGSDQLYGNQGNDVFNFSRGSGKDMVFDFQDGDKLAISSSIYHNAKEVLSHTSYSGNKAVIDLGSGDNVTLVGITEHLSASDISIV